MLIDKLTLRESVAVVSIKSRLVLQEYKILSNWLGVYNYIVPDSRDLNDTLIKCIVSSTQIKSTLDIFKVWLVSDWLDCCVTKEEQTRILKWTQDCNYFHTPVC